jgi:hypothetical protein
MRHVDRLPRPTAEAPQEIVSATLLTSPTGAEVHLFGKDGQRLRLAADEETAKRLALSVWQALDNAA